MKNFHFCWLLILLTFPSFCFGQKLKKPDKLIVKNIQHHVARLSDKPQGTENTARTSGMEYICKQFERLGLQPRGTANSWYMPFDLYEGREVLPATRFVINSDPLELYQDYFPLCFSANNQIDTDVSVALAEKGVPWFIDLSDILEHKTGSRDTSFLIREKARQAASKGATAIILYNSGKTDPEYNPMASRDTASIPVVYLKKNMYKKYVPNELAHLHIQMNVLLADRKKTGSNILGYANNGADSTLIISAPLDNATQVAALIELARLVKGRKHQSKNYLFIVYDDELKTVQETAFLNLREIKYNGSSSAGMQTEGLNLVKHSLEMLR